MPSDEHRIVDAPSSSYGLLNPNLKQVNWHATSRRWKARVAVACAISIAITYVAFCFWPRPSYSYIIDKLPETARLVHYEFVRHGLIDFSHLYEFSCSDAALREKLVAEWKLQDLTTRDEEPTQFVINERPNWWTPETPQATHKYGRRNEETESYSSIWEHTDTGRLYVEFGRW